MGAGPEHAAGQVGTVEPSEMTSGEPVLRVGGLLPSTEGDTDATIMLNC